MSERPPMQEGYEMPAQQPVTPEIEKKEPAMPPDVINDIDKYIEEQEEIDEKKREKKSRLN